MIVDFINNFFSQEGYTIITKKKCGWSKKARSLLRKHKKPFVCIDVSKYGNVNEKNWGYQTLKKKYKITTFPLIFDENGKRIGGYTELAMRFRKVK